ncbi:MAG: PaaI family thioesterase [Deltaproteobacteria bacterium]|nr:PaaI family thioesterase [Deltaproteobacteria bacterium]
MIRQFLTISPFVGHLGMRLVDLTPDHATLMLPFTPSIVTVGDVVHGGAISALVDTTAMASAWSMPETPATLRGTTVALSVDFVTAACAQDLTAAGRVIRRGRSLCFCEVEVRDASGQVVAIGLVTYKLG